MATLFGARKKVMAHRLKTTGVLDTCPMLNEGITVELGNNADNIRGSVMSANAARCNGVRPLLSTAKVITLFQQYVTLGAGQKGSPKCHMNFLLF